MIETKNKNVQDRFDEDEITLKELILKTVSWWKYICSKWILILGVVILGGIVGFIYAQTKKPLYKAELSFALEDEDASHGVVMGLASQFGFDLGGSNAGIFSGDNLLALMKSHSMVESTLLEPVEFKGKKQTLAEVYIDFNHYRDSWKKNPSLTNIHYLPGENRNGFSLKKDSLLRVFFKNITKENLSVEKTDKKLSIINVTVISADERFSKLFAEVLVSTVSNFYIETKTKKSAQNMRLLQHQSDSVRRELNAAITGVASSIDLNPNPNFAHQILRVPSQRRQVDVQANQAIFTQLNANLENAKLQLRKETPLIQIIDRPFLPLDREVFSKTKGIVIGAVVAGFLCIVALLIKKSVKDILA
jgi:hypothetical protein